MGESYDPHEQIAVEALNEGDLIDLENDEYADPYGHRGYVQADQENPDVFWHDYEVDHMYLESEYAQVEGIRAGKGSSNTVVYTSIVNVAFPHGYMVRRYVPSNEEEDKPLALWQVLVDGIPWEDAEGKSVFCLTEANDVAEHVADQGYEDIQVEYLDN